MNKHLKFYKTCMKTGMLPIIKNDGTGLCASARHDLITEELLNVFIPTREDELDLHNEGLSIGWWGSGVSPYHKHKQRGFTPLRQTIVAFMAVITLEDFE